MRTRLALLTLVLGVTGCTTTSPSSPPSPGRPVSHPIAIVDEALAVTPGEPAVDVGEIISGGPGVDGIPAVDEPVLVPADEAARSLVDTEQVLLVEHGGEARAYPLRSLIRHEITNDVVGGLPVAATWCPLCNTGVVYDRRLAGGTTTFGVSGNLYRSAMIMYDRATRTLWSQPTGRAIVGELTGTELDLVPAGLLPWSAALASRPDLTVALADRSELSSATNPYVGYDTSTTPFLFRGQVDDRLPPFERVAGVSFDGSSQAWSFEVLSQRRVVAATVGGQSLVVLWAPGATSALDTRDLRAGREVGASAVYDPVLAGRELIFAPSGESLFRDLETGSTWTIAGVATAGPLAGQRLDRLPSQDAFWFAWAAFNPESPLAGG